MYQNFGHHFPFVARTQHACLTTDSGGHWMFCMYSRFSGLANLRLLIASLTPGSFAVALLGYVTCF